MTRKQPPAIVVDTREKKELEFPGLVVYHRTLKAGDYSLHGYENAITVERKSMNDLFTTLVDKDNNARFRRELDLIKELGMRGYLLIEGTPEDVTEGSRWTNVNGFRLLDRVFRIGMEYDMEVVFGGSRPGAALACKSILHSFHDWINTP